MGKPSSSKKSDPLDFREPSGIYVLCADYSLQRIRRIIGKVMPDAEETISYQIPTYKLHGQDVVYFAGWKKRLVPVPVTDAVRASLGSDLEPYATTKGTVRFPLAEPVPAKLVERIVRELLKAAQARARTKNTGRRRRDA